MNKTVKNINELKEFTRTENCAFKLKFGKLTPTEQNNIVHACALIQTDGGIYLTNEFVDSGCEVDETKIWVVKYQESDNNEETASE